MKKILATLLIGLPVFVNCSAKTEPVGGTPVPSTTGTQQEPMPDPEPEPTADAMPDPMGDDAGTPDVPDAAEVPDAAPVDAGPAPTPDNCLDGQDMDAADVDISKCPPLPSAPGTVKLAGKKIELGAWEIGTTSNGLNYAYGSLSAPNTSPRVLNYAEPTPAGMVPVNDGNVECWAKGYYRLRKILQAPPAEWVALKNAGFQFRFFQFQTDLRNGPTGFKAISSFQDHLVKWVTVINKAGVCQQPTFTKFKNYAKSELTKRNLPLPP
jgi:hypothetical protein